MVSTKKGPTSRLGEEEVLKKKETERKNKSKLKFVKNNEEAIGITLDT